MKKLALAVCLLLTFGRAGADELADAQTLWETKDFIHAFQGFTRLANAGNAAAQLQLGEMYGFGEGTPEDASKAVYWLKQAAEHGNREAPQSLALLQERGARKAEIAYYTTHFDGAAVAYDKFACVRPTIPAVSTKNAEIVSVNAGINAWSECYGRFVRNLNGALPAEKTIPADILKLMSNEEFIRAGLQINAKYSAIAGAAQKIADQIGVESGAWKTATEKFVAENNAKVLAQKTANAANYDQFAREVQDNLQRKSEATRAVSTKSAPIK